MNLDIPCQLPQFYLQRRPYHVKERREQEGMTKTDAIVVNVPYSYRTLFRQVLGDVAAANRQFKICDNQWLNNGPDMA